MQCIGNAVPRGIEIRQPDGVIRQLRCSVDNVDSVHEHDRYHLRSRGSRAVETSIRLQSSVLAVTCHLSALPLQRAANTGFGCAEFTSFLHPHSKQSAQIIFKIPSILIFCTIAPSRLCQFPTRKP